MNSLDLFSPKISIETNCKDYIIDMIAFVLDKSEIEAASIIHSKPFEKYLVIVVSRCSTVIAYSFDEIILNSKKCLLYEVLKAHPNRILCIKSFKPSVSEQNNLKVIFPFCFITGGLDQELRIWDALTGNLLKKIAFHEGYIADCLIFQISSQSLLYDDRCGNRNSSINRKDVIGNVVLSVGPVKTIAIVDIEFGYFDYIPTYGERSVNSIEAIGTFASKKNSKNNYLLFCTVDKGSLLTVWKISKKKKNIECKTISKLETLLSWNLGLTSFANSPDPFKRKYLVAVGGSKEDDILQHKFNITIINWRSKIILRSFHAHLNWINTLRSFPYKFNGKMTECLISGSADEKIAFWDIKSGNSIKDVLNEGDRVVMHGMRLFLFEENDEKKFFMVSGGCNPTETARKNIFKVWM